MSQKFFKFILPFTAFLTPLFFLPITVDFFGPNKQLLLTIIASLCLLFYGLEQLSRRQLRLTITPATFPLIILALVFVLSSLIQTPNHLYALSQTTSTIIALTIIFLTTTTMVDSSVITPTLMAMSVSLALSSLFVIYQYTGLSAKFLSVDWLKNNTFNPLGGPFAFLTFAVPLLPINIYLAFKQKQEIKKIILFVISAVTLVAIIMAVSLVIPNPSNQAVVLLPFSAGWAIAVDIFKTLRTALLGTGPETFLSTFTQLKPIALNRSIYWNLRFNYSSNEFLHLLTTTGIIGLVAFSLALIRPVLGSLKKNPLAKPSPQAASARLLLVFFIIVNLLVPSNTSLYSFTFFALILVCLDIKHRLPGSSRDLSADFTHRLSFVPLVSFLLMVVFIGANGYLRFNVYASEVYFYQSLLAAQKNSGTDTYNLQIKSIEHFPYSVNTRLAYSQTNLALANSIASKTTPSDQDKANVAQLIQQSIREAKAATVLEPQNVQTWENLAQVYRQLISVAQGADQWAAAAYSQAIALDPINPQLRLDFGGLYYSLKDYDSAIRLFQQAIEAKADWSNAHYNLSHAYLANKNSTAAIASMRVVTQLIDPTSPDYQKAQDELNQLNKQYPSAQPGATAPSTTDEPTLATPSPVPSPTGALIQLPDASGLNIPAVTPTPSANTPTTPEPSPAQ